MLVPLEYPKCKMLLHDRIGSKWNLFLVLEELNEVHRSSYLCSCISLGGSISDGASPAYKSRKEVKTIWKPAPMFGMRFGPSRCKILPQNWLIPKRSLVFGGKDWDKAE